MFGDQLEILDLYKALIAMGAGAILGLERELKDKAAGLKTITIICLGSALFAILSLKIGGPEGESTRIASYIVSGVGFLGAGVIFKDGVNVSGLTTAGIIWLAAALGTSIGFGQFYLAAAFMLAAIIIIYTSPKINDLLKSRKQTRTLVLTLDHASVQEKEQILADLIANGIELEEKRFESRDRLLIVTVELVVKHDRMVWLEKFLLDHSHIKSFSF